MPLRPCQQLKVHLPVKGGVKGTGEKALWGLDTCSLSDSSPLVTDSAHFITHTHICSVSVVMVTILGLTWST